MKIKAQLNLAVGVLFGLIILLAGVGIRYVYLLAYDAENILKANYQSLDYATHMLEALEGKDTGTYALSIFEQNLQLQEKNITEPGEKEATERLAEGFRLLRQDKGQVSVVADVRREIHEIMRLNMDAIVRKNAEARITASRSGLWISATGALCFLIAFVLLVNVPGSVANPIRQLTESIGQIAARNYKERIHIDERNEFGELAASFNLMASRLEEYENSNLAHLMYEKKRIETLINNMHDPIVGFDEHERVAFVNEKAIAVLGLERSQLIGGLATDLAARNDLMRRIASSEGPSDEPLHIFADGKESYFNQEVIPITVNEHSPEAPKLAGRVIILKNITPFKELDAARTHFIATISHELKTPIASLLMSANLLSDKRIGEVNAEQLQLLQTIREDGARLLKITGELLNMAQIETGNLQLNLQPSEPEDIIRYAVAANHQSAAAQKVQIQMNTPAGLPRIQADPDKTAWVLINLISNAIRYSYEQSEVEVSAVQVGEMVEFSVRDHGKGISPAYQAKIFERYFRVPESGGEGTGLGLAIGKEFIEAQGGQIGVESQLAEGSRFFFRLPALRS
ncbi:MAG: HAMP domain-containing protein [Bacteroidetes bacterium]|nr:MAG: HAMP domain-containing protein [Bacteroidota bacterium]